MHAPPLVNHVGKGVSWRSGFHVPLLAEITRYKLSKITLASYRSWLYSGDLMGSRHKLYTSHLQTKSQLSRGFLSGKCRLALCFLFISIIVSLAVFLVVYFFVIRVDEVEDVTPGHAELILPVAQGDWTKKCPVAIDVNQRFDCYPEFGGTEKKCNERGCCWIPVIDDESKSVPIINITNNKSKNPRNIPVCVYPENYGYAVPPDAAEKQFLDGWELPLTRLAAPSRYGDDAQNINVRVHMQTPTRLRIKFYSSNDEDEGDVMEPIIPVERDELGQDIRKRLFAVSYRKNNVPFGLEVRRLSTGTVIFNTGVTGFTFSNYFRQITTLLPSDNIFGLGPLVPTSDGYKNNWNTWSLFTGSVVESTFIKSHGGHPMYMCLEKDGNAHAVLLHNSHAIDFQQQPTPALTFRTLGGSLDFYIFLGPKPEDVVKQYLEAVGRPFMPSYWMLGLQISHVGVGSIEGVKNSLRDIQANNISYDVISLGGEYKNKDIDFTLDHRSFTNFLIFTEELARQNRYLDVEVDPSITVELPEGTYPPYDEGNKAALFINSTFRKFSILGETNSGKSAFLDFGNKATEKFWARNLERLHNIVRYQSLTVTNNQPLNWVNGSITGCSVDNFNNPPYIPSTLQRRNIYWQTLCMDSWQLHRHKHVRHYSVHNLYSHNMNRVTNKAMSSVLYKERRSAVLSQATFTGSGKYVGFWAVNVTRSWKQLEQSINTMLSYNLYGIPLVGTAICGTEVYEEDEELCLRWTQLGAFYPLARLIQDPIFCSKSFGKGVKMAIDTRYKLLPYLYTLFYKTVIGIEGTVARPLFHEFYRDKVTYNISQQFMWGSALMIVPILQKSVRLTDVYFPEGYWYFYHTGGRIISRGEWVRLEAPLDRILLLIRGGHSIPTLPTALTTFESRKNNLHLIVALDDEMRSYGNLYWDDGVTKDSHLKQEYILSNFTVRENKLQVSGQKMKSVLPQSLASAYFDSVDIMGLPYKPLLVAISGTVGVLSPKQFLWDLRGKVVQIRNVIIPLAETVEIEWRWVK